MSSTATLDHLSEKVQLIVTEPPFKRMEYIRRDKWIPYPGALGAVQRMERIFLIGQKDRPIGLLVVGPTNNGKSKILQHFLSLHPPKRLPEAEANHVPCVVVQAPSKPDISALYNAILDYVDVEHRASDTEAWKQAQVYRVLPRLGTQMILIDEFHNILAGHFNRQRQFLNAIKNLSNEIKIPIVCAGTKEALRAIASDKQLENRIHPHPLSPWRDGRGYRQLLRGAERDIPLKRRSNLDSDAVAHKILDMTKDEFGSPIGEILTLLEMAGVCAIESGKEKIDEKILDETGYVGPMKRQEQAERAL